MRAERAPALALAALLACCRGEPPPPTTPRPAATLTTPSQCRTDPDGAALTADRGIGGTGGPVQMADRGIGGTGIVGVITGFASVCLAGQEVALPPDVTVAVDQRPASTDVLRAGQVAVIDAAGDPAGLRARRIVIRYEVVGSVERAAGDAIRVAGQDVALSPQSWGIHPARGDWVAVSGLRRGDGTIEATRVERQAPGPVLIHGMLVEDSGGLRIGALPIRRDQSTAGLVGHDVTITGMIGPNAELLVFSAAPDILLTDPAAYFGPRVGVVLIESFAVLDGGRLHLAPGFSAPAPGLHLDGPQRGVFRFERFDGGLRATGLGNHPSPSASSRVEPAPRFEPAPMPDRAIRGPASGLSRTGPGGRGDAPRSRSGRSRGDDSPRPNFPNGRPSGDGPPRGR